MSELNQTIVKAAHAMLMKFNNRFSKNQRETESTLFDWAEHLAIEKRFTVTQIGFALSELTKQGRTFMPNAYEIAEVLTPKTETKEEAAPVIVAEMIKLIRAYGKYDEARMFMAASPEAKLAFRALGDTSDIRNSENFETTKAQLERLVKGVLAAKSNQSQMDQLQRIGIHVPKEQLQKLDYSGFLPPEGA
jgi:hypothetical protein